ncbi:MAG: aspartyl protease family protein [Candidatus Tyrphobacter sp.]
MRLTVGLICAALFVVASSSDARAQNYAPTPLSAGEIIGKMVAATGQLTSGSYLVSERQRNGDGTVTQRTVEIDGSDFIALEQTGSQIDEYGRYGGLAWYRDPNGTVIPQEGETFEGSAADVAWIQKRSAKTSVSVLGLTQTAPQQYVLSFESARGDDVTAYVDAATNLLSRIEYSSHDGKWTTEYSDYHTIFGVTVAFDERDSQAGAPQNGSVARIASWTQTPTSEAAMAIPSSQPLFQVATQMTLPAQFTYQGVTTGDIVLHATIGGQSVDLVLDSGSTDFNLDPGAAARLGLTVTGKRRGSVGGPLDVSQTIVPEMTIGPLTMRNVAFTVLPVEDIGDEGARPVGLIGCDFFQSAIVGVDFKDRTLTLYPRSTFDPQALGLVAVPIRTNNCVPEVAAMIEGVHGLFLVDTGADLTLLSHSYLRKLSYVQRADDSSSMFSSTGYVEFLGGQAAVHTYVVNDFVFAGTEFRTGYVQALDSDNDVLGDDDGTIGRNVLRAFKVYFDYADGVAFFKVNQ